MSRKLALLDRVLPFVLPIVILAHVFASPYSKVEESFNIQATYDILIHGLPLRNASKVLSQYDHAEFPGSVPRTFVGAAILAGLTRPFTSISLSPATVQLISRAILGLINAVTLYTVKSAVDTAYGKVAGRFFVLIQASQFHIMYYASRTLPNIFAMILTNVAVRNLVTVKAMASRSGGASTRRKLALFLLTVAGIVFRSEIALLLAMETLSLLTRHRASLTRDVIPAGVVGVIVGLSLTISVDSLFWQKFPMWPELEGFIYNTILGKSSDWGTSPFHFYLLNALPRVLINPLLYVVCIPGAFILKSTRKTSLDILLPHFGFILVYSLLPHKEWRFIMYSVPAFNAVSSATMAWIWTRRAKSLFYSILSLITVTSLATSFLISFGLCYISSLNYPGGDALADLHHLTLDQSNQPKGVFLDNLACQTGITRFQQIHNHWIYDKSENETARLNPLFWQKFDYAIVEHPERVIGLWEPLTIVKGFDGVTIKPNDEDEILPLPSVLRFAFARRVQKVYQELALVIRTKITRGYWPAIRTTPKLYVLERQPPSLQGEP